MSDPALSVAMSVYNGASHLALAIESILTQTYADFEFLILNDGSSDASADIIDRYAARDPRIRPIHRDNRGLIASLNQLVEESRAPLIARMDADDISMPERFAKQMAFMAANPAYGVVGTWTSDIDEHGAPFAVSGADHPTDHEAFIASIGHISMLCHPSVMMRRNLVLSAGGYHNAFKHCEDYDLWLRLASVTKLCSLPERLVQYRHWSNQVSNRFAYTQQIGAAVSYLAYLERSAGRADPTASIEALPPVDKLDTLFGRAGFADAVRGRVAPSIIYSQAALKGDGFPLLLDYIHGGGQAPGLWRTVARLMRFREPAKALQLFLKLATR
jgi:GT2 family glycosyltransferase